MILLEYEVWPIQNYLPPLSSKEDSDAVSSKAEVEVVSDELPFSPSENAVLSSVIGLFKHQYMMLAVRVSIIF